MPVTTRFQVESGNHTPFVFEQLETPPRCPHRQPCTTDPEPIVPLANSVRHNPLYSFENPSGTPCGTPKGLNDSVTMVHPEEVLRRLEEKAHDNRRIFKAMYAKGKESQQNEKFDYTSLQGNKGTCSRNPFENNEGNNTLPKTPRVTIGTCPSHHDSDEDVTSEDVMKFQQDSFYQKLMLRALEENGDQYF